MAIAISLLALLAAAAPRASADIISPQLSAGIYSTCSISQSKRLYCWGSNRSRQAGLGNGTSVGYATRPYPVRGISAQPVAVSVGYASACAVLKSGVIGCWGKNRAGALGARKVDKPVPSMQKTAALVGPRAAPANESTGGRHICYRDFDATVKCLGKNVFGQLGNGIAYNSSAPTRVAYITGLSAATRATQVVSGASHSCALLENHNVSCWGLNNLRQLGTPANPVGFMRTPIDVPNLRNDVTQLASMADHSCAIHAGGDVSCWGANGFGQLGDGSISPFKGAVGVAGLGAPALQVSTGIAHSCALIRGGSIKCWGSNQYGQLGDGTSTASAKAVTVTGLSSPAVELTAGGYHSCARLDNGRVYCWGRGNKGQLGDGTTKDSLTPTRVIALGGVHFASVRLSRAAGQTNFQGTLVALPPHEGRIRSQCRANAHLTVSVSQGGRTYNKKLVKRLSPRGTNKCTARFRINAISNSVAAAKVRLRGVYHTTRSMPRASLTEVFVRP